MSSKTQSTKSTSKTLRIGSGLMFIFLALAAIVQLNDPDSLSWMLVYGVPCLLTLAVFVNSRIVESSYWSIACTGVFAGVLAFFITQLSTNYSMDNLLRWDMVTTEEGRESVGVGIVLVWLIVLIINPSALWYDVLILILATAILLFWATYKLFIQSRIELPEHCSELL